MTGTRRKPCPGFLFLDFNGADGAALGGLLSLIVKFGSDLVPGGGHALGQHGEYTGTEIDTQTAADTGVIYANKHCDLPFFVVK